MKVMCVDSNGKFGNGAELSVGDMFVVDISTVGENEAKMIAERGLEIPLVVEEIYEDSEQVKPKFFDFLLHRDMIIKKT